jgi:hypothetical protein
MRDSKKRLLLSLIITGRIKNLEEEFKGRIKFLILNKKKENECQKIMATA